MHIGFGGVFIACDWTQRRRQIHLTACQPRPTTMINFFEITLRESNNLSAAATMLTRPHPPVQSSRKMGKYCSTIYVFAISFAVVPSVGPAAPRLPGYIRNYDRHKLMFRIYYDILFKINISYAHVSAVAESALTVSSHYIRSDRSVIVGRSDSDARASMRASCARVRSHIVDTVITHMVASPESERKARLGSHLFLFRFIYFYWIGPIATRNRAATTTFGGSQLSETREKVMWIKLQIPLHLWHVSQSPMDVRCDAIRWDETQSCEQWKSKTMDLFDLKTSYILGMASFIFFSFISIFFFSVWSTCVRLHDCRDWWIQFFFARI